MRREVYSYLLTHQTKLFSAIPIFILTGEFSKTALHTSTQISRFTDLGRKFFSREYCVNATEMNLKWWNQLNLISQSNLPRTMKFIPVKSLQTGTEHCPDR